MIAITDVGRADTFDRVADEFRRMLGVPAWAVHVSDRSG